MDFLCTLRLGGDFMSRISNERIKVLTQNESRKYSKLYAKEHQRMRNQTSVNLHKYM